MNQSHRTRNIILAGLITGLILATVLAFSWPAATNAASSTPEALITQTNSTVGVDPATVTALQAENEQLRAAVNLLLEREAQYQVQIDSANQTILQLQNQINNQPNGFAPFSHHEGQEGHDD